MQKKLIAICGATASGKTALAVQLAKHYNTAILSFDSRQCYQELKIGVAKPNIQELAAAQHFFINSHSIHSTVNAAIFEQYALQTLETLFAKYDIVIAVGGTGLYLNALCNGVDAIPTIPNVLRQQLQNDYTQNGLLWLQSEIKKYDNNYTEANDLNNAQRMLRALEVVLHTGNTIKYYHTQPKAQRNFIVQKYAIAIDRELLYSRINQRVDIMVAQGLEHEVQQLQNVQHLNALQTVGYTEWWPYFEGKTTLHSTIETIQQHTRNYAKRQLTWFNKDKEIVWVNNVSEIL